MYPISANLIVQIIIALITLGILLTALRNQRLKIKESKRPQILDEVQRVILPFIDTLTRNIDNLDKGSYGLSYFGDKGYMVGISSLFANFADFSFKDFSRKYKKLRKSIDGYNDDTIKLEGKLGSLYDALATPKMQDICVEKVKSFIEKSDGPTDLGDINTLYRSVVSLIIYENTGDQGWFKLFWDENREFFLKFRDEDSLKKYFEDLSSFSLKMKNSSKNIKNELEKILEKYRSEYDISQEELKPFDWVKGATNLPRFDINEDN